MFNCIPVALSAQQAEVAFTIEVPGLIPEGITYDPGQRNFYIGSLAQRRILKLDERGRELPFLRSRQDDLGEVLGLAVNPRSRTLWACNGIRDSVSRQAVHVYSLQNGQLMNKYLLPPDGQKHLFNDLVILANDDVIITDTEGSTLYIIRKGSDTLAVLAGPGIISYPNGITVSEDQSKLYVATSTIDGILTFNLHTLETDQLATDRLYTGIFDGLYFHRKTLIGIQNVFYPEMICRYRLNQPGDSIVGMNLLAYDHPLFAIPTTGVIVGDAFYFIANSNVHLYLEGRITDPSRTRRSTVMKVMLK